MAMGLGVGSGEMVDLAEGPLGRGEEPGWITGSGRRARRARRRVRQRVRKRRTRAAEADGTEERVAVLEARVQTYADRIDILNAEVDELHERRSAWTREFQGLRADVKKGLGEMSAVGRLAAELCRHASGLSGVVKALDKRQIRLAMGCDDLRMAMVGDMEELGQRIGELGGLPAQVQLVEDQQSQAEQQAQALAHASAMWAWERFSGGLQGVWESFAGDRTSLPATCDGGGSFC